MPILSKNPAMTEKYDLFMQNALLPSILQSRNWALVKDNWQSEQVYVEEGGEIVAASSLLIRKMIGKNFVYAPRGFVVAPFNEKATSIDTEHFSGERRRNLEKLLNEIDAYAKSVGAFVLALDPEIARQNQIDDLFRKMGFKIKAEQTDLIQPKYLAWLDIDRTEEEMLASFSSKTRYNIRLAQRKGVYVEHGGTEGIAKFFELHQIMAKRNNIAIRGESYYHKLMNTYQDSKVFTAYHEGEALASAILVNYHGTAWYAYGASSNSKRNYMPNQLMQWEMIKWAKEHGAIRYDFSGFFHIDVTDGLYRFKSGFTGKDNIIELVGKYEKVYNKFTYSLFNKLLPQAKKVLKFINKR